MVKYFGTRTFENQYIKILLVEDDKRIAGFISKGLKQEGFSIAHAANGMDGYLLASTEKFDAAIIDIMLPKIDGLTLIDKLREKRITMPTQLVLGDLSLDIDKREVKCVEKKIDLQPLEFDLLKYMLIYKKTVPEFGTA